jgi:hypothetical protein
MQSEGPMPCSQEPDIGSYPKPNEYRPQPHIQFP